MSPPEYYSYLVDESGLRSPVADFIQQHRLRVLRVVNSNGLCGVLSCQAFLRFLPKEVVLKMSQEALRHRKLIFPSVTQSSEELLSVNQTRTADGNAIFHLRNAGIIDGPDKKGKYHGQHIHKLLSSAFADVPTDFQETTVKFYGESSDLHEIINLFRHRPQSMVSLAENINVLDAMQALETLPCTVAMCVKLTTSRSPHGVVVVHPPNATGWLRLCNATASVVTVKDVGGSIQCLIGASKDRVKVEGAVVQSVLIAVADGQRVTSFPSVKKGMKRNKRTHHNTTQDGVQLDLSLLDLEDLLSSDEEEEEEQPTEEPEELDDGHQPIEKIPKPSLCIHSIRVERKKGYEEVDESLVPEVDIYSLDNNGAKIKRWRLKKTGEQVWMCRGGKACRTTKLFCGNPFSKQDQHSLKIYLGSYHFLKACCRNAKRGAPTKKR